MADKVVYELTKEHINITTIGHVDHGKTTLSAAITKYLSTKGQAKFKDYEEIDRAPEEKDRGITINATHLEFETDKKHYSLVDCPGHADYVKNMITGASQADGAILVVAATDGAMPQTKEHLRLARQIGIKHLVTFINKVDIADSEMLDLVEMEIRGLLGQYGFDGQKSPFIKGSAKCALDGEKPEIGEQKIKELLDIVDEYIPTPLRDVSKPFLMAIGDTFMKSGRGTLVSGSVIRGELKPGEEVEIVGLPTTIDAPLIIKTKATEIQMFYKPLSKAKPGYDIAVLLQGIKREQTARGQVLAAPGSIKPHTKFEATAYILTKEEGGRHTPFGGKEVEGKKTKGSKEYRPQFHFRTADVTGSISLPENIEMVMPGDNIERFTVELANSIALENNDNFSIREGGKTVGEGKITKIIK